MTIDWIEPVALNSRSAGYGPLVVCLHASGSSSTQWEPLIEAAEDRYCFVAFDLYGHGRSAPPRGARYRLATETEAVLHAIAHAAGPIHLVGHSYGGAVALDAALQLGSAVASVTVYEPVLFGVLDGDSPEYREIAAVASRIVGETAAGRHDESAALFVDYWSGAGSWARLAAGAQQRITARMPVIAHHFDALSANPVPLARMQVLTAPVQLLHGDSSPAPALAVARRLSALTSVETRRVDHAGHMGPITHARDVMPRIVAHLDANNAMNGRLRLAA